MVGVSASSWYRQSVDPDKRRRPGPAPRPIPEETARGIVEMAKENPWYGYKKIAIMCRRGGANVSNQQAYAVMRQHGLLQKRIRRRAEVHQTAKLFELLPKQPNDLWQMDVTYIHIPGHGWWYAVTVIDYYSRYLLACHLCSSYCSSEVVHGLRLARKEAERIYGPIEKPPFLVTDNGSSFISRRFNDHIVDQFTHVRIPYRTPTQLGLLERFHRTLKEEEVYWRMYDNPQEARECLAEFRQRYNENRPHWALVPTGGGDPLAPADVYCEAQVVTIPKWQGWAIAAKSKLEELTAV
jgi:transposase InsO family protein